MVRVHQESTREKMRLEMHDRTVYPHEFLLESVIAELGRCELLRAVGDDYVCSGVILLPE